MRNACAGFEKITLLCAFIEIQLKINLIPPLLLYQCGHRPYWLS